MAQTKGEPAAGTERHWTRSSRVRMLAGLNAGLLAAAALVGLPAAIAQDEGGARAPGRYILVGGQLLAGDSDAVYIIDTTNQEMIVMRWNDSRNRFDGLGFRDLEADAKIQGVRR